MWPCIRHTLTRAQPHHQYPCWYRCRRRRHLKTVERSRFQSLHSVTLQLLRCQALPGSNNTFSITDGSLLHLFVRRLPARRGRGVRSSSGRTIRYIQINHSSQYILLRQLSNFSNIQRTGESPSQIHSPEWASSPNSKTPLGEHLVETQATQTRVLEAPSEDGDAIGHMLQIRVHQNPVTIPSNRQMQVGDRPQVRLIGHSRRSSNLSPHKMSTTRLFSEQSLARGSLEQSQSGNSRCPSERYLFLDPKLRMRLYNVRWSTTHSTRKPIVCVDER